MIVVNLEKAKSIAHERRRAKRELEFAPFDALIAKQIPGSYAQQAEVERQKIRNKYDEIQIAIDKAETPDQIKAALEQA
jgi:D-serine deaminase-like pyridoxal phosphate-dependent protein